MLSCYFFIVLKPYVKGLCYTWWFKKTLQNFERRQCTLQQTNMVAKPLFSENYRVSHSDLNSLNNFNNKKYCNEIWITLTFLSLKCSDIVGSSENIRILLSDNVQLDTSCFTCRSHFTRCHLPNHCVLPAVFIMLWHFT